MVEFLVTEDQELWVFGLKDGVMETKDQLFPIIGKFLTGQAATTLKAEGAPGNCLLPGMPCFQARHAP